jgi:hypothetical protein
VSSTAARRAAARLPEEARGVSAGSLPARGVGGGGRPVAGGPRHDLAAGDRHDAVVNARWLADALLVLGEERRAAEVLRQALEIAAAAPQVPSEIWLRARLAGLASTEADEAAAHLARCEQVLATGDDWRGLVGEVGSGPRRRGPARCRLPRSRGGRGAGGSRSSMTTGCRGGRWRRCTRGDAHIADHGRADEARARTRRRRRPCSPGSGPRSGGGPTSRPQQRSCTRPQHGLNAPARHSGHDRFRCPRRLGEQRVRANLRRRGGGGPLRRLLAGSAACPRRLAGGRRRRARFPSDQPCPPT